MDHPVAVLIITLIIAKVREVRRGLDFERPPLVS
jgi:hypothetical protein